MMWTLTVDREERSIYGDVYDRDTETFIAYSREAALKKVKAVFEDYSAPFKDDSSDYWTIHGLYTTIRISLKGTEVLE